MQGLSHNLYGKDIGLRRALLQAGQTQPRLPRADESTAETPLGPCNPVGLGGPFTGYRLSEASHASNIPS
jgi:hypothetical protein